MPSINSKPLSSATSTPVARSWMTFQNGGRCLTICTGSNTILVKQWGQTSSSWILLSDPQPHRTELQCVQLQASHHNTHAGPLETPAARCKTPNHCLVQSQQSHLLLTPPNHQLMGGMLHFMDGRVWPYPQAQTGNIKPHWIDIAYHPGVDNVIIL